MTASFIGVPPPPPPPRRDDSSSPRFAAASVAAASSAAVSAAAEGKSMRNPLPGKDIWEPHWDKSKAKSIDSMDPGDAVQPIRPGPRWRQEYGPSHKPPLPTVPKKWPEVPGSVRWPAPIPLMRPIHRKQYYAQKPTTERYAHGDYTISGGTFASENRAACHLNFLKFKICLAPCSMKNADNECRLRDVDGECICVDPCVLLDEELFFHQDERYFGQVSSEAGCDFCVGHKAAKYGLDIGWRGGPRDGNKGMAPAWSRGGVKPQPRWTYEGSPFSCGFCDNKCVSGNRHGPTQVGDGDPQTPWLGGNACGGTWNWGLHDCRRARLTPEDEAGSEVEVQTGENVERKMSAEDVSGAEGDDSDDTVQESVVQ